MNLLLRTISVSTILAFASNANASTLSDDKVIDDINNKYKFEYSKLEQRGRELNDRSPEGVENAIGVDIDFKNKKRVSFEIPEFRMKQKKIVFDLPSITMRLKRVVWHNPEVTMTIKKIGQYPVFHGFTVRWRDIRTKVPVTKMVPREAKLHLPEFHSSRQEYIIGIPEVFRKKSVKLDIPEITVRSTKSATNNVKNASKEIEMTANKLSKAHQKELKAYAKSTLVQKREQLIVQRDIILKQIGKTITEIKKLGLNPTKVPQQDGKHVNLAKQLSNAESHFDIAIKQLNDNISEL